jgi:hypothetical protein
MAYSSFVIIALAVSALAAKPSPFPDALKALYDARKGGLFLSSPSQQA